MTVARSRSGITWALLLTDLTVDVLLEGPVSTTEWQRLRPPGRLRFRWDLVSRFGDRGSLVGAACFAAIAGRRQPERVVRIVGRLVLGVALRAVLARIVRRPRPPESWWHDEPSGFSFPSRHVTWCCLAVDTVVDSVAPRQRTAPRRTGTVIASAVALSRVRLGVHWPSDVLAAWAFVRVLRSVAQVGERPTSWYQRGGDGARHEPYEPPPGRWLLLDSE
jgi:membrane-associated phospholipid phosphatase